MSERENLTKVKINKSQEKYAIQEFCDDTIPPKIFGIKWSNQVKLDRKRKIWYLFLRVF